jgi:hypothetical protein
MYRDSKTRSAGVKDQMEHLVGAQDGGATIILSVFTSKDDRTGRKCTYLDLELTLVVEEEWRAAGCKDIKDGDVRGDWSHAVESSERGTEWITYFFRRWDGQLGCHRWSSGVRNSHRMFGSSSTLTSLKALTRRVVPSRRTSAVRLGMFRGRCMQ